MDLDSAVEIYNQHIVMSLVVDLIMLSDVSARRVHLVLWIFSFSEL